MVQRYFLPFIFCFCRLRQSFCNLYITIFTIITHKTKKCGIFRYFFAKKLLKSLAVAKKAVPLHCNQETTRLLLSREILLYLYCSQPPAMLRRCQRWRGEMTAKLTCPLCTQPTALAKMQACKVSEYKQKAINCISQKTE